MIEIQKISNLNSLPKNESIVKWAIKALEDDNKKAEVVIRIVDMDESRKLNKTWRKKDYATNVLSFPASKTIEQAPNILGDIVICANLVISEAKEQKKNINAHCAHLVIHGILHLQGYDPNQHESYPVENQKIRLLMI